MTAAQSESEGLARIQERVRTYQAQRTYYRSTEFDETSTRNQFINPLFEALGWDVLDTMGLGRHRDVVLEARFIPSVPLAGSPAWDEDLDLRELANRDPVLSIPDYRFSTDGVVQLLVEAKRPGVSLRSRGPVFQVKSYAYTMGLPVGVLANFEDFRVFDASLEPRYDSPSTGVVGEFSIRHDQLEARWPKLWQTFSRDAVAAGSLAALRKKSRRRTHGSRPMDEALLSELEEWRGQVASDLYAHNHGLDQWELAEATQRILDRIIFIRVCEDRRIESVFLRRYARMSNSYKELVAEFRRLDSVYNGQLFAKHFSERLSLSDSLIQGIIERLYYPISPYRFDVLGPDLLGSIYERFLGHEIAIERDGRVTVELKPEIRHAGGVYYTPRWIVDQIVALTLAPLLKGKAPRAAANVRILDPACGSGAFLLGAFEYLIAWHEQYFTQHPTEQADRHYTSADGSERLTSDAKSDILERSIFGIDIDQQAVEVTQMSLYLKLLEHEDNATLHQHPRLFQTAYLPKLDTNIRSGNSLLGPDNTPDSILFGELDLRRRVNAFDWDDPKDGFGAVAGGQGGFDVVIGNPPYTRSQDMRKWRPEETTIYASTFKAGREGSFDIASLFVERALPLLRKRTDGGGRLAFIITRQFAETDAGRPLRELLTAGHHIDQIIDFSDGMVFPGVGAYTMILVAAPTARPTFQLTRVPSPPSASATSHALRDKHTGRRSANSLGNEMWDLTLPVEGKLLARLEAAHPSLLNVAHGSIFQGVVTGADYVFKLKNVGPDPTDPSSTLCADRHNPGSPPFPVETDLPSLPYWCLPSWRDSSVK
jgi:type I restriction-modification system DNA methylase subunit